MRVLSEQIVFSNDEIKRKLEQLDKNNNYEVKNILYYPYLVYEYMVDRKGFFHPLQGNIGCTIDGVNKIGAVVDFFPELEEADIKNDSIIHSKTTLGDAEYIAKEFLHETIAKKKKIFTVPELKSTRQEMFYRPYWIVEGETKTNGTFLITVDAVSGKFHPL